MYKVRFCADSTAYEYAPDAIRFETFEDAALYVHNARAYATLIKLNENLWNICYSRGWRGEAVVGFITKEKD